MKLKIIRIKNLGKDKWKFPLIIQTYQNIPILALKLTLNIYKQALCLWLACLALVLPPT